VEALDPMYIDFSMSECLVNDLHVRERVMKGSCYDRMLVSE